MKNRKQSFVIRRLADLATLINGRAYLMPELQESGKYRIVRVGNFSGKNEWFYSDMELEPEKYCENGDLLYKWACNFGPEIWKQEKTIYHYHIWKVVPKDIVDKMYLYYYLKYITPFWLGATNGATMVHITKESMEKKKLLIPLDINYQRIIASILSAYDNLIEVNNKRIRVLEQMAENLYKEWFVRFRFPGHETAEFENGMPMGWKIDRVGNIAKLINGRAFLMPELKQVGKYRIVRVGNFSGKDEWFYSDMELDDEKYCQNGDLLYKWACNFGPEFWNEEKVIYHYHIWKVVVGERINKNYLYYLLKQSTPLWLGGTNGATMVHITKESMEKKKVLVPSKEILSKFERISSEILSQIQIYQKSNVILEKQRDLLLPRLMSGKLEV